MTDLNQPADEARLADVETAALTLAAAAAACRGELERFRCDTSATHRTLVWETMRAARVDLLLVLGAHAVAQGELDVALYLLQAAAAANGNVDDPRLLENQTLIGPIEHDLQERLVRIATGVVWRFRTEDAFTECAGRSTPQAFLRLILDVERERRWAKEWAQDDAAQ